MSITKRIAFGAAASWFSRGVTILMGLVLMPVLFRHLPKEELGVWLLLGQSWAALGIFDLGFGFTLTRRIAFAKGKSGSDPGVALTDETLLEIADLVETGKRVYRALAAFAFIFSMGAGFFYLRTLHLGNVPFAQVWLAWSVICLSQALGVWANIWNAVLLGVGYVGWDAVLGSLANALTLLAQIVAVLCGGGLVALATVAAAGALTQRFLMLGFARSRRPEIFSIRGQFNFALVKGMVPLALRAWATALGYTLVMSSDQFFIASFQGAKEIPAYRAAFILVINLGFVSGVFNAASQVFVSHLWQAGQLEQIRTLLRRNVFIGLLCMGCGGAVLIGLGSVLFDLWLRPGNFVGYPVLITFLAIFVIESHANVFGFFGRSTGDEAYAWTSVGAGLLKIFLAFLGIKMFGLLGLALSTLVAQGVTNSWFMVYRAANRLNISLGEHVLKVLVPCAMVFGITLTLVMGVRQFLGHCSPVWQIAAGTSVAGGVLMVALWALVLTTEHRSRLLRFLQRA